MREIIESIFGIYAPVMTEQAIVYTTAADGVTSSSVEYMEVVASGLAGVDWPWIAGVALFSIVLYSFFRLVGVVLKNV